jgi:hypothetical protein
MRAEDEADDQLIADQLQIHVITRSQSQAAEHAKQNDQSRPSLRSMLTPKIPRRNVLKQFLPLNRYLQQMIALISQCQKCRNFRWRMRLSLTNSQSLCQRITIQPACLLKGDMVVVAVKAQKQTRDKATV